MSEKIFADGIYFSRPNPKAPSYIKGRISVKVDVFKNFIDKNVNESGYVNLNLKVSKNDKLYFDLDTWTKTLKDETKAKKEAEIVGEQTKEEVEKNLEYPKEDINPDDIPF